MEMLKNLSNQCVAKEGASASDVDEAMNKKPPSSRSSKCFRACMGETLGLVCFFFTFHGISLNIFSHFHLR